MLSKAVMLSSYLSQNDEKNIYIIITLIYLWVLLLYNNFQKHVSVWPLSEIEIQREGVCINTHTCRDDQVIYFNDISTFLELFYA